MPDGRHTTGPVSAVAARDDLPCVADVHAMLVAHGDWMELGGADEQGLDEGGAVVWGGRPTTRSAVGRC